MGALMNRRIVRRCTSPQFMSAILLTLLGQAAQAQELSAPLAGLWAGFGLGYGYLQTGAAGPAMSSGSGVWVEGQLGARLGRHWLTGFELGGVGTHISASNYDSSQDDSSVYGQSITHELVVLQYAPRINRGWFVGAGAGGQLYDNKDLQAATLNRRSGNGRAGLLRAGYNWGLGRHTHVAFDLNYERGDVRLNAPFEGRFTTSIFAVDVHIAYY